MVTIKGVRLSHFTKKLSLSEARSHWHSFIEGRKGHSTFQVGSGCLAAGDLNAGLLAGLVLLRGRSPGGLSNRGPWGSCISHTPLARGGFNHRFGTGRSSSNLWFRFARIHQKSHVIRNVPQPCLAQQITAYTGTASEALAAGTDCSTKKWLYQKMALQQQN